MKLSGDGLSQVRALYGVSRTWEFWCFGSRDPGGVRTRALIERGKRRLRRAGQRDHKLESDKAVQAGVLMRVITLK